MLWRKNLWREWPLLETTSPNARNTNDPFDCPTVDWLDPKQHTSAQGDHPNLAPKTRHQNSVFLPTKSKMLQGRTFLQHCMSTCDTLLFHCLVYKMVQILHWNWNEMPKQTAPPSDFFNRKRQNDDQARSCNDDGGERVIHTIFAQASDDSHRRSFLSFSLSSKQARRINLTFRSDSFLIVLSRDRLSRRRSNQASKARYLWSNSGWSCCTSLASSVPVSHSRPFF